MNERIKELAEQATIRVNNPTVNSNGKVICDNWEEGVSLSKFAELIVQEVFAIIENESYEIYKPVVQSVKNHFGMKE